MVFELELLGVRVVLILAFASLVHVLGVRHGLARSRGWNLLVLGLLTLAFGFLLDILGQVPGLTRLVLLGESVEAELLRLAVYVAAFALLGGGFAVWLPELGERFAASERASARREQLEADLRRRTQELTETNRGLSDELRARASQEATLRAAEERLRQVADAATEVLYLAEPGPEGIARFLLVSPAVQDVWGLTAEDLDRDPGAWARAVDEEDRAAAVRTWSRPPKRWRQRLRLRLRGGGLRWVEDLGSAVLDAEGRAVRLAGVVVDVTERVLAEEALQRSEAKHRALLEHLPDAVVTLGEDGSVAYASPGLTALGATEEDLRRAGPGAFLARVVPEDQDLAADALRRLFAGGRLDAQYRWRRGAGAAWVHVRSAGAYERDGQRLADCVLEDVSELRTARERLWRSEELLLSLTRSLPEALWLVDAAEGRVVHANRGYEALFGRSRDELAADPLAWLASVHPQDAPLVRAALATPGRRRLGFRVVARGVERRVSAELVLVRDAGGALQAAAGLARDVTGEPLSSSEAAAVAAEPGGT